MQNKRDLSMEGSRENPAGWLSWVLRSQGSCLGNPRVLLRG